MKHSNTSPAGRGSLRPSAAMVRRTALDALFYVLGSILYALSVNVFTAPNHIAPGGVTGISTLVNYLVPGLPIGTLIFVINLPLFFAAWRHIGREFTVRTALCTAVSSLCIDLSARFIPPFRGDMILTAVFGGVLAGAGLGLIYMRGATTGGSEIVARLLERKFHHIPIGRLILAVDAVVVAAAAAVYRNLESALYAIVLIFVSTSVMDMLVYGGESGKMLLIMTRKEKEISADILAAMHRGVTMLNATGAYTGGERKVLLVAVRRSEVYKLRTLVYDRDPAAFIIVVSTDEVLGEGFKRMDEPK
jgi:uncharacterized membrane-anchored protein YitT (DUF2179 family)